MPVKIASTSGYLWLDSWIMANIIQLSTQSFCRRFLNRSNDPCGRQYDQMTQAARSVQANIAEGVSRHQTSIETEMRLIDVSRASLSELASDYLNFLMSNGQTAWSKHFPVWAEIQALRLEKPAYSDDLMHDVSSHIIAQKHRFDRWAESEDAFTAANAMLILCGRLTTMLRKQIAGRLESFKRQGGFTENMTQERMAALKERAVSSDAPACPKCGKPMIRRMARKGNNSGNEFWSCQDYPGCNGTRDIRNVQT